MTGYLIDEGFYWVRPNEDEPFEVALFKDRIWWFHGLSEGAETIEEIGAKVELAD